MSKIYPCAHCTEDGYCKKYSDEEVTSWCVQSPCKDEKPSNADRIRSLSDEKLAKLIADDWCELINCESVFSCNGIGVCNGDCEERILKWLKEEVEDDNTNKESES